ncbi:MAG: hypothetical protein RLP44_14825 [Aggregatilineales bacterium]
MKKAVLALVIGVLLLAMPVLAQSTSSIAYGDTVSGTVNDAAQVELWEFEGSAGDVVTITMIADASSSLDTRVFLYTVAGRDAGQPAIAENDDSGDDTIGNFNSQIADFELPESTTYVIEATRFSGDGDYELTLSAGENEVSETQFIEYGAEVTGTLSDDSPSQIFEFLGDAGDVVTITMIADASSSLDTRLFLYDEDGYLDSGVAIAENDDSGDSDIGVLNSRIADFELPDDGFYYIEATSFGDAGDYTLTLASDAMSAGVEVRQWASFATGTSQYGTDSWSFMQATGEPNTAECGDYTTAWASSSSTGSDTLALEFDTPVRASEVNIYQTYNPGSIIRVELSNTTSGEIVEIPNSADPLGNTPCPGVFTLAVPELDLLADGVLIYFDQTIGGGWNEIDAVELVGIDPNAPVDDDKGATTGDAQTVALDDGASSVTVSVPASWAIDYDGTFTLLASAESAMVVFTSSEIVPAPAGEAILAVISPESLSQIAGEVAEQTTAAYLEAAMGALNFTGEILTYEALAVPASVALLEESTDVPPNAVLFMLEIEEGFVWVVGVTGGDPSDFEPELIEIMNSLAGVAPSFAADSGNSDVVAGAIDFGALSTTSFVFANGAMLEIDAPSDFFTQGDDEGYYYIANSESVLDTLVSGNSEVLPEGALGVTVIAPGTFDGLLELADGATARQALEAFVTAIGSTGAVEDYLFINDNAVYSEMAGELAPPNAYVIVTDNEDGIFFFAIQIGPDMTFASVEDTIIEIINSLSYTP